MIENPDIPKRFNKHYHRLENDEVVESIFNSGKNKERLGMLILERMLTEEMKLTRHYQLYALAFRLDVPMTHALRKSAVIRIRRRSQPDSETSVPTAAGIDIASLDEATQMSIGTTISLENLEAQQNVKRVKEHLVDEEIVEGNDDVDENQFVDEILNSQKDPDTRIEPESHKERPEVEKSVDLMIIDDQEEKESAEDALRRKKGKGIEEIKNTPPTKTLISPRTHSDSLSSDKEELRELTASEPTPSSCKPTTSSPKPKKDFKAIIEAVHVTLKKVVPSMVDKTTNDIVKKNLSKVVAEGIRLERQKVQNDITALAADAIQKERESIRAELSVQITHDVANTIPSQVGLFLQNYMSNHILHVYPTASASYTILDLQHQLYLKMKDDERARDADLAIWLSLKIKYEKPVPLVEPCRVVVVQTRDYKDHHDDDARPEGESSAKRQKTSEYGTFTTGIDDDEVPSEEVTPELLDEVSGKVMTSDELQRMQNALTVMMEIDVIQRRRLDRADSKEINSKWNPRAKKYVPSMHKIHAFPFLENDLEEWMKKTIKIFNLVKKTIKRFNLYARYAVDHWKSPWVQQDHIRRQLKTRDDPEKVYSEVKIVDGIEEERLLTITSVPVVGLIYENNKKEKRVMDIKEIPKFCDATLKRVLEKLNKFNLDVKHCYAHPDLSNEDAEYMMFYEEYIQERLRHHDQMRR
ncbi:hypothetical protein Tco_1310254 [Tanacetum coccineum]